jgi:hypothetical protein
MIVSDQFNYRELVISRAASIASYTVPLASSMNGYTHLQPGVSAPLYRKCFIRY